MQNYEKLSANQRNLSFFFAQTGHLLALCTFVSKNIADLLALVPKFFVGVGQVWEVWEVWGK